MANSIQLFKKNAPELLDKIYKAESTTAEFDTDSTLVRAGANANEILIPVMSMQGLGEFKRNSGYIEGDVTLTMETKRMNYERGRKLSADIMDNEETAGVILGNLSSEFLRTKVVPEVDAVRYAKYSATTGASSTAETLSTAAAVYAAIAREYDKMTDAEVPEENRHLRITSALLGLIRDMDTTKSRELLNKFASIKVVPQSRFQTAIELKTGKTGEEAGGFAPAAASKDINFMIIHKPALLQFTKHAKMKVFTPDQDQDGDNYKWLYRIYGLNEAYDNKAAGIAVSHK